MTARGVVTVRGVLDAFSDEPEAIVSRLVLDREEPWREAGNATWRVHTQQSVGVLLRGTGLSGGD
ncbi:hypothetical protein [Alsobacter metallidurans]|uniref:hypothetical protein n=1 Tax=Alsobacter metallidurans TaxID=340221 RepID=UPI00188AD73D|nr:hypothetical protein [Alsobacter metallidurans]